jgi:quinol monooxygenase YgiN
MIIVTGQARFEEGEIERLRPELAAWTQVVRGRDGCESYHYAVDIGDPNLLHVIETWRDEAAIDAHINDMGELMAALGGAKMAALSVAAYEARFVKTLMGD